MEVTSRSSGRGGDRTRSSLAAAVAEAASARASGRASSNARAPAVLPPADAADSADLMDESANARLLGARRSGSSSSGPPPGAPPPPPPSRDAPMTDEAHAVRLNVLNSSVQEAREARNSRLIIWGLTLVNAPQVVAATTVMALKWREQTLCYRIQVWVLVHTAHLAVTLALEWAAYYLNRSRSNRAIHWRERYMGYLSQLKYGLDLAGLFWFLVGNMWVISDGARCDDGSAMYQLALWMIVIAYAKIFLPCLLLLMLLPVICFCLPCVIRLLSRLQDPMRGKGATREAIDRLDTRKFAPHMFASDDATCCICLNDYETHQDLRVLPCDHHFHKDCVDEWLLVNSTCPTCRKSIYDPSDASSGAARGGFASEDDVLRNV